MNLLLQLMNVVLCSLKGCSGDQQDQQWRAYVIKEYQLHFFFVNQEGYLVEDLGISQNLLKLALDLYFLSSTGVIYSIRNVQTKEGHAIFTTLSGNDIYSSTPVSILHGESSNEINQEHLELQHVTHCFYFGMWKDRKRN